MQRCYFDGNGGRDSEDSSCRGSDNDEDKGSSDAGGRGNGDSGGKRRSDDCSWASGPGCCKAY